MWLGEKWLLAKQKEWDLKTLSAQEMTAQNSDEPNASDRSIHSGLDTIIQSLRSNKSRAFESSADNQMRHRLLMSLWQRAWLQQGHIWSQKNSNKSFQLWNKEMCSLSGIFHENSTLFFSFFFKGTGAQIQSLFVFCETTIW